jgi:hypothetical protein
MPKIYACEIVPSEYPPIEPIEAPLPFENIEHFEGWLCEKYIPRTLTIKLAPLPNTPYDIDVNKTECWAIFSSEDTFERCCQVYPFTHLTCEFEDNIRGKILSHNHFSDDGTLSCGDVLVWANLQMKEVRAVTQSKTYSIKPINLKWSDPKSLSDSFTRCPSIENGEMRHRCLKFLAKRGFFKYSVIDF